MSKFLILRKNKSNKMNKFYKMKKRFLIVSKRD